MIARHDMVLATGHLGRDEIFAVVDAALEEGVEDIVVTHPGVPVAEPLGRATSVALAERGALLERCFTHAAHRQGRVGAWLDEHPRDGRRATRSSRRDLGQVFNPPVEDGLALMADRLLGGRLRRRGGARDGRRQHAPVAGAPPL